jgi:hypothetical protein
VFNDAHRRIFQSGIGSNEMCGMLDRNSQNLKNTSKSDYWQILEFRWCGDLDKFTFYSAIVRIKLTVVIRERTQHHAQRLGLQGVGNRAWMFYFCDSVKEEMLLI